MWTAVKVWNCSCCNTCDEEFCVLVVSVSSYFVDDSAPGSAVELFGETSNSSRNLFTWLISSDISSKGGTSDFTKQVKNKSDLSLFYLTNNRHFLQRAWLSYQLHHQRRAPAKNLLPSFYYTEKNSRSFATVKRLTAWMKYFQIVQVLRKKPFVARRYLCWPRETRSEIVVIVSWSTYIQPYIGVEDKKSQKLSPENFSPPQTHNFGLLLGGVLESPLNKTTKLGLKTGVDFRSQVWKRVWK